MRKLTVELAERSYPIFIERGILNKLSEILPDKRHFVITNEKVFDLYRGYLRDFENVILIGDGEEYKNLDTYKMITDKLLELKIERSDCIIAFGGGIVGDIAGFVAATVLRGVDFIQIPTTLLAQVDSSVGGKTGVNHACGKNLIGSFYQPKMVLIDPDTLKTLDEKQMKTGLGEVIKYAFIEKSCIEELEGGFLNVLLEGGALWEDIIYICCALKAAVVAKDEHESGLRAILNFGHTFAHAIEKVTNYTTYTHGEAVSIGIKMAFKLSLKKGLIEEGYYQKALSLLDKYDLNITPDRHLSVDKIYEAMKSDKKVDSQKIKFVLPTGPSQVGIFADIEELLIKESLL